MDASSQPSLSFNYIFNFFKNNSKGAPTPTLKPESKLNISDDVVISAIIKAIVEDAKIYDELSELQKGIDNTVECTIQWVKYQPLAAIIQSNETDSTEPADIIESIKAGYRSKANTYTHCYTDGNRKRYNGKTKQIETYELSNAALTDAEQDDINIQVEKAIILIRGIVEDTINNIKKDDSTLTTFINEINKKSDDDIIQQIIAEIQDDQGIHYNFPLKMFWITTYLRYLYLTKPSIQESINKKNSKDYIYNINEAIIANARQFIHEHIISLFTIDPDWVVQDREWLNADNMKNPIGYAKKTLENKIKAKKTKAENEKYIKDTCKDQGKFDININREATKKSIATIREQFSKEFKEGTSPKNVGKLFEFKGTVYNRVETGSKGHCMFSSVIFGMFYKKIPFSNAILNSGWNPPITGFFTKKEETNPEKQHTNCFMGNLRDVLAHDICKKITNGINVENSADMLKRLIFKGKPSNTAGIDYYAQDSEIQLLSTLLGQRIGVFTENQGNPSALVIYSPSGNHTVAYDQSGLDEYNYENDVIYIYNLGDPGDGYHFQYVLPQPDEAAIKFATRRNEETVIKSVINAIVNPTDNSGSESGSSVNITGDNKLEMKQTQKTLDRLNKINEEIEELKKKKKELKEKRKGLDPTNDANEITGIDKKLAEIKKAKEELIREQNLLNKIGIKNITWEELLAGISGSMLTGFGASAGITFGVGAGAGVAAGAGVGAGALGALAGISAYKYYYKEKEKKEEEKETEEDTGAAAPPEAVAAEEEKIRRRYEHTVNITHDVSREPNSAGDHTRYSTVTVTDIPSATTAEQVEHALYNLLNDSKDSKKIKETITFNPENSKVEENK